MTEDRSSGKESSDFDVIVSAAYRVDERQLLRSIADSYYRVLPIAESWVMSNLPDYLYLTYSPVERVETIACGIDGWLDFTFCETHLRRLNMESKFTEGQND